MFWTETRAVTRKLFEPVKSMLAKESASFLNWNQPDPRAF